MNLPSFLIQGFDASPWFAVTLPVLSAMPTLRTWQQVTGIFRRSVLCRIGRKSYRCGLFAWLYFSGCLTVLFGLLLYFLLLNRYFPLNGLQSTEITSILCKCVNTVLAGGVFPVIAALLSMLLHDPFLAVTLPMMLQYLSMKCCILYDEWLFDLSAQRWESKFLLLLHILFPSNCCMWNSAGLPFVMFFVVLLLSLAVLYAGFRRAVDRKVQDQL